MIGYLVGSLSSISEVHAESVDAEAAIVCAWVNSASDARDDDTASARDASASVSLTLPRVPSKQPTDRP